MKYFGSIFVILAWVAAIGFALVMATGIAEGSAGWAIAAVFGFAFAVQQASNKIDTLQRRIARLEDAMGKHHRFHGHFTDY